MDIRELLARSSERLSRTMVAPPAPPAALPRAFRVATESAEVLSSLCKAYGVPMGPDPEGARRALRDAMMAG